jgi:hypothetical protein
MSARGARSWLGQPELYREVLGVLRDRHADRGTLAQAGLELAALSSGADAELARRLARTVASGEYRFSPVVERRAFLGGKWREVYRAPLADTVVLFALAKVLTALVGAAVSERVHSYRKGRSSRQAVRELAAFVRRHRRERPAVTERGLHVLRRDIARYGDSIPVDEGSALWPLLGRALADAGVASGDPLHALLARALRPVVSGLDGTLSERSRGVPMGSPLQPLVCNLYLDSLDQALAGIAGGFYARFGDDLLLAHADLAVVRRASERIEAELAELGLVLNREKSEDLFWNGAGRPAASAPSERGTTHVEYLGSRLAFDGAIAPSKKKLCRIRAELRERIVSSERLLRATPVESRLRALSRAVTRALDPEHEVALFLAGELFVDCDDRRALAELDHWLARTLAQALSGRSGVRAFRSVPPRLLRRHGLVSLVARRARAARPDAREDEP